MQRAVSLGVRRWHSHHLVSVGDHTALAKRAALLPGFESDPVSDKIYDVNKDGKISVGDQTLMAKNSCTLKPFGIGCPGPCPAE